MFWALYFEESEGVRLPGKGQKCLALQQKCACKIGMGHAVGNGKNGVKNGQRQEQRRRRSSGIEHGHTDMFSKRAHGTSKGNYKRALSSRVV